MDTMSRATQNLKSAPAKMLSHMLPGTENVCRLEPEAKTAGLYIQRGE